MFRHMTRERYLSDLELERFMSAVRERRHVNQPRDHALFALLANTGMRPAEVRALTVADLHLEGRAPWVRVVRLKKRKTVPEFDDLPITVEVASALALHVAGLAGDGRVFTIPARRLQRMFHAYCRLAGIRRINLYSLRHTAATRLYVATRNIGTVQALLGHERPDMTALYAHVPRAMLRELASTFPAIV
jgi:integrase